MQPGSNPLFVVQEKQFVGGPGGPAHIGPGGRLLDRQGGIQMAKDIVVYTQGEG